MNTFEDGRLQSGSFVELLPFENAQGLANHIAFIGVTTGVNKTIHKLIQRGRKGNCHGKKPSSQPDFVQIGIAMVSRPLAIPLLPIFLLRPVADCFLAEAEVAELGRKVRLSKID
jgi:hypothetical protein